MLELGRLEEVNVRELWIHEQCDFSNWLAKEENIELLNEVLGLTLVDIEKEVFVGAYRCELVAKDETSGQNVIIENQLEASNHDHLGKIVTYASGLDANVIVWIVKEAREEHRSAIEWLNNNTNKNINFFLIEIHAYKIGNSLYAPKFEIVEKANVSETEKFALLFEFDGDINTIRHILYNCSASRPSIESETKEDTIEPGTETQSITADPREDGLVKSRTGDTTSADTYANWYKNVYVPQAKGEAPKPTGH